MSKKKRSKPVADVVRELRKELRSLRRALERERKLTVRGHHRARLQPARKLTVVARLAVIRAGLALLALGASVLAAQEPQVITGVVRSASGGELAGASVTLDGESRTPRRMSSHLLDAMP
jgi:type VI protein secretion system component VasF